MMATSATSNRKKPVAPNRRKLTEFYVKKVRPRDKPFDTWDTIQRGLRLKVQPSGHRNYSFMYSWRGRPRWMDIGHGIPLKEARKIAAKHRLAVLEGHDIMAEKKAERGNGTFAELWDRYLEHAKKNKAWRQSDYFAKRFLLPKWGRLDFKSITSDDVQAVFDRIKSPSTANQVLALARVVFNRAAKKKRMSINPCHGVEPHKMTSRDRVLNPSEVRAFWAEFDRSPRSDVGSALKLTLLLGQRPGEVCAMRIEQIDADGWWTMEGAALPNGWVGTKNKATHMIWLPPAAQAIIADRRDGKTSGRVFPDLRRAEMSEAMKTMCVKLGIPRATPHDLRRTHGTSITRLGFGREAMNRIQNHKEGGIADVYDRHAYAAENQKVMETVADHILALVG
jgi:integrase